MSKRTSDIGLATLMLFAGLALSACGGGGSSSSGSSGGDDGTLKPGLYNAKIEYTGDLPTQEGLTSYLSPTGKFAIVYGELGVSIGELSFDGTDISGTSNDYRLTDPADESKNPKPPEPRGFLEFKGLQGIEEGSLAGTVNSQTSATFTASDATGKVYARVSLKRVESVGDLGLSLERVSGVFTQVDPPNVALRVDDSGSMFAQYPKNIGCGLNGTLSVPDSSINIFEITYTMESCENENHEGAYSGVGFLVPAGNQSKTLIFTAHNGKVGMQFEGTE
ncbi:MAG: hypothetical protein ABJM11_02355 [Marinobacter sp.]|uniref:hypothetical protein n=1 Tax=Marinobacter sp. TaxID=50741 RepID=UPI00329744AF